MAVMNFPAGTRFARALRCGLHIGDGGRGFQARVVAGAQTQQDDVIVIVDQAGDARCGRAG